MASEQERLCTYVLRDHFGDVVGAVGAALCRKGRMSMRDIAILTKLPKSQVQTSLYVLIQHGLVVYETVPADTPVFYEAIPDRILLRIRHPKFIQAAKNFHGHVAEVIVQTLLLNGFMSADKLFAATLAELTGADAKQHVVESKFAELVKARILRRLDVNDYANGSAGAAAAGTETEYDGTVRYNERLFELPPLLAETYGGRTRDPTAPISVANVKRRREDEPAELPPAKKGRGQKKSEPAPASPRPAVEPPKPPADVYWVVNADRFLQIFRNDAIANYAAERIDVPAGRIVATMLRIREHSELPSPKLGVPLTETEIHEGVQKMLALSRKDVSQYLDILRHTDGFVVKVNDGALEKYAVAIERVTGALREQVIESVVNGRFGPLSKRLFRLIKIHGNLEQKQVADFAMVPSKEAKERLYQMLRANFLQLQEISKTPDHAPSRTFFLWTVDMHNATRMLITFCLRALGNIRARQAMAVQSAAGEAWIKRAVELLSAKDLETDATLMVLRDF